jgi:hypothetical protein
MKRGKEKRKGGVGEKERRIEGERERKRVKER